MEAESKVIHFMGLGFSLNIIISVLATCIIVFLFCFIATRKLAVRPTSKSQLAIEYLVDLYPEHDFQLASLENRATIPLIGIHFVPVCVGCQYVGPCVHLEHRWPFLLEESYSEPNRHLRLGLDGYFADALLRHKGKWVQGIFHEQLRSPSGPAHADQIVGGIYEHFDIGVASLRKYLCR